MLKINTDESKRMATEGEEEVEDDERDGVLFYLYAGRESHCCQIRRHINSGNGRSSINSKMVLCGNLTKHLNFI